MAMEIAGAAMGAAGTLIGAFTDIFKPMKARLVAYEIKETNGVPGPGSAVDSITCMFNPTEYTWTQSVTVNKQQSQSEEGANVQYGGSCAPSLETELFFDAFTDPAGDITVDIRKLLSWMRTHPSAPKERPSPPFVQFIWGGDQQLQTFYGYLSNCSVTYKLFRKEGTPVRATVKITITGREESAAGTNPTSRAVDLRMVHTLLEGESLHSVAYAKLGRASAWRAIAAANGIDDPLRVRPGTSLLIPSTADAERDA